MDETKARPGLDSERDRARILKPETIERRERQRIERDARKARLRAGLELDRVWGIRGWNGRAIDVGLITFRTWFGEDLPNEDYEELFAVDTQWERRLTELAFVDVKIRPIHDFVGGNNSVGKVLRQRARAAELGLPHDLTHREWLDILNAYGLACAYCGFRGQLVMEHVWPISLGGGTTKDNVVPACARCNYDKRAMTPDEYFTAYPLRGKRFKAAREEASAMLERKAG